MHRLRCLALVLLTAACSAPLPAQLATWRLVGCDSAVARPDSAGVKLTTRKTTTGVICLALDAPPIPPSIPPIPPVTPPTPVPPSSGEPVFRAGIDSLIHADNFDAFASTADRYTELKRLRSTFGPSSHPVFINDNRNVESPPASFFTAHQVVAPGRGGSGRALRCVYPGDPGNTSCSWKTWPEAKKYPLDTSTNVVTMWLRVVSVGWQINNPGWKFWEAWHPGGTQRTQVSIVGGPGNEVWSVNPASRGTFGVQPAFAQPHWKALAADGAWHRLTFVYRPNTAANDTTGVARLYVDGSKVVDLSALGARTGYCTVAEVRQLTTDPIQYIKWPDVLNSNAGRGTGIIETDDFTWHLRRAP